MVGVVFVFVFELTIKCILQQTTELWGERKEEKRGRNKKRKENINIATRHC